MENTIEKKEEVVSVQPAKETKKEFINPFDVGVSYDEFLKAVGKQTIAAYCKGKLTEEQIEWLENDIKLIKINK